VTLAVRLSRSTLDQVYTLGSIKRVHLIWSVRTPDLINSFSYLLIDKVRNVSGSAVKINLHLHCTSSPLVKRKSGKLGSREILMNAVDQGRSGEALNELADEDGSRSTVYDFDGVAPDEKAYSINYGRPNYGALFKSIAGEGNMPNATSPSVACMVCGPAAMVDEVSNICFEYNFYFQAEEFHF